MSGASGGPPAPAPAPAPPSAAAAPLHRTSKDEGAEGEGPVGLRALCAECARLYPDQPNPLQVTARVKYWLGGPDPLDYVSMYWNTGRPELGVPPHWHYISLGLSDLHGDGRVHAPPDRVLLADAAHALPSGFGFEMTFRLAAATAAAPAGTAAPSAPPPLWPAALLQSLARYIFNSGVRLCVGDHVSWHTPLDAADAASRVRHLLVAEEPQLRSVRTPLGHVQFVQLVGATGGELRAARRGAGSDVLRAMSTAAECGGAWLVTDAARRATCGAVRSAAAAAARRAADLAGVSTPLRWAEWTPDNQNYLQHILVAVTYGRVVGDAVHFSVTCFARHDASIFRTVQASAAEECGGGSMSPTVQEQIKLLLQKGLQEMQEQSGAGAGAAEVAAAAAERGDDVTMSTESIKSEQRAATELSTDSLKQLFTGGGGAGAGGGSKQMSVSSDSFAMCSVERALAEAAGAAGPARALAGVHVVLNAEGGSLLPLALQGRVLHSRHFTWRCASGARAVTFVSAGVSGALVSPQRPYVATAHGWLQVLVPAWLARDMCARTAWLERAGDPDSEEEEVEEAAAAAAGGARLPLVLAWPRVGLKLTVLHPDTPLY